MSAVGVIAAVPKLGVGAVAEPGTASEFHVVRLGDRQCATVRACRRVAAVPKLGVGVVTNTAGEGEVGNGAKGNAATVVSVGRVASIPQLHV